MNIRAQINRLPVTLFTSSVFQNFETLKVCEHQQRATKCFRDETGVELVASEHECFHFEHLKTVAQIAPNSSICLAASFIS